MTAFVPSTEEKDLAKVILSVQQLAAGRSNAVKTVSLRAGFTTTTVTDANVSVESAIQFMPMTANAAAAISTSYVGTVANKSFVITHANNAQVDRTFRYSIHG